jgi:hypothetical protein
MKRIIWILFFISSTCLGQFFQQEEPDNYQNSFYASDYSNDEPDRGLDNGGANPADPIPINQGIFYLIIVGIMIGYSSKKK